MAELVTMDHVGFIGLGDMATAMAQRLLAQEYPLTVYDTDPAAVAVLREAGASVAASPREVADVAEIIIASLPSREMCREVAFGADGIDKGETVEVYIETSDIDGELVEEISAQLISEGIDFADARIGGSPAEALEGTLTTTISGSAMGFERVRPLFEAISKSVTYLGETPSLAQDGGTG